MATHLEQDGVCPNWFYSISSVFVRLCGDEGNYYFNTFNTISCFCLCLKKRKKGVYDTSMCNVI